MSKYKYQHSAKTLAEWTELNPVILENEIVIEKVTWRVKIGNGVDHYLDLPYGYVGGVPGRGIIENGVVRTSGNGAPGTTDTYTITFSDATTTTFTVVNGANGTGAVVANDLGDDEAKVINQKVVSAELAKKMNSSINIVFTQLGYHINTSGNLSAYAAFRATDLYPVFQKQIILYTGETLSSTLAIAGYNSSQVFTGALLGVSTSGQNIAVVIPKGVEFIRICGKTTGVLYNVSAALTTSLKKITDEIEQDITTQVSDSKTILDNEDIFLQSQITPIEFAAINNNLISKENRLDQRTTIVQGTSSSNPIGSAGTKWLATGGSGCTISQGEDSLRITSNGAVSNHGFISIANFLDAYAGKYIDLKFKMRLISGSVPSFNIYTSNCSYTLPSITSEWIEYEFNPSSVINVSTSIAVSVRGKILIRTAVAVACVFEIKDIYIGDNVNQSTHNKRINSLETITKHPLFGKKVSVMGDSITIGALNPELKILQHDIDNSTELSFYCNWFDVYTARPGDNPQLRNKTCGGYALQISDIGQLITFTPLSADLGKEYGNGWPLGSTNTYQWFQQLVEKTGATLLANASWTGSGMGSFQNEDDFVNSHAFHQSQINRLRVRNTDGTFNNPEVIILYKGTNDFSHTVGGSIITRITNFKLTPATLLPITDAYTEGEVTLYDFKKSCMLAVNNIRNTFPDAQIYICTLSVFKRNIVDTYPSHNGFNTQPEYNQAIIDICNEMGVGVVELHKNGITWQNLAIYTSDLTHPNEEGHGVIANKCVSDIKYVFVPAE